MFAPCYDMCVRCGVVVDDCCTISVTGVHPDGVDTAPQVPRTGESERGRDRGDQLLRIVVVVVVVV